MAKYFNITHSPFLKELACFVIEQYQDKPEEISNLIIYLDNRNLCNEFTQIYLSLIANKAALLPKMEALDNLDAKEAIFYLNCTSKEPRKFPETLSKTKEKLLLTKLIIKWAQEKKLQNNISIKQAALIANNLLTFLSTIKEQNITQEDLLKIIPLDFHNNWQETVGFLSIIITKWPELLAAKNLISADNQKKELLLILSDFIYQDINKQSAIIYAGTINSTNGSLLLAISNQERHFIIFHLLDKYVDEKQWNLISEIHPQYEFKNFLNNIKKSRNDIIDYKSQSENSSRGKLLSYLMYSPEETKLWHEIQDISENDIKNLKYIECESENQEAEIIALYLRYYISQNKQKIGLITSDEFLLKKVKSFLKKWDIAPNEENALNLTPQIMLMRLICSYIDKPNSAKYLLSLLKHPLVNLGFNYFTYANLLAKLETRLLVGISLKEGLEELITRAQNLGDSELTDFIIKIKSSLENLLTIRENKSYLKDWLNSHLACAFNLCHNEEASGKDQFYKNTAKDELNNFFAEIEHASNEFFILNFADYADLFENMIKGRTIPNLSNNNSQKIFILPKEQAKFLDFDQIILSSFNEGFWPANKIDATYLNLRMLKSLNISKTYKDFGAEAYSFLSLINNDNILITRSVKNNGAKTISSRWLIKLAVILKHTNLLKKIYADKIHLKWLEILNKVNYLEKIAAPAPTPPIEARPKTLPVTAIEQLMRNPYGVYAKYILKLKKLKQLDYEPSMADFGNVIHDALENFSKNYNEINEEQRLSYLVNYAKELFKEYNLSSITYNFWQTKLENIAKWIINEEETRRTSELNILAEVKTSITINDLTITAKADRIEFSNTPGNNRDNSNNETNCTIIDYKTGTIPTKRDIYLGLSPQMIIEALIVTKGQIENYKINNPNISDLLYWKLSGNNKNPVQEINVTKKEDLEKIIDEAEVGLLKLQETFNNKTTPYLATPAPEKAPIYNDYELLARTKEWQDG